MKTKQILVTGGSGLLGKTLQKYLKEAFYPSSKEFNITDYSQMNNFLAKRKFRVLLHAAAFTSPPKIEANPEKAIITNIIGTANIVRLAMKYHLKLIYISTDYIFKGDRGNYRESDPVYPVNKYAWSKLGGECAVKMNNNSLIIRTSFGPKKFPYKKAFIDQYTSRETVDVIAKKIISLLNKNIKGIIHLGGKRKNVHQYATQISKAKIQPVSIKQAGFKIPHDTSLNTDKFDKLMNRK